ncbi:MAG: LysR family transcriptional regulator [Paracoccaceae bacterium]
MHGWRAILHDMEWDDLKTIMALVRFKTLAGAGAALGVNYTTVSRRIGRAEKQHGGPLFERLAEGYHPTEAAYAIAEHAARMEAEENALMRKLQGMQDTVSGPLSVTAPQLLIAYVVAPVIEKFTQQFPNIELTVRATNDVLDLSRREADLAIRISSSPGDDLKGLRLCAQETADFALANYAERMSKDPDSVIDWIAYVDHPDLPKGVKDQFPNARVRYRFDDMMAIAGAAQAGLGVARMPMFLGRALGLSQIPALPPQPYADVWLVGHADVWPGARMKAFRDILVPFMRREASRFVS